MRRTVAYASRVYSVGCLVHERYSTRHRHSRTGRPRTENNTRGTRMLQCPVSRFAGDRQTVWLESRGQLRGALFGGAEFRLVFADAASEFGAAAPFPAKDAGEFLHDFAGLELFDK